MTKCQRCEGTAKLYRIEAKCSDLYSQVHLNKGTQYDGYVPEWIGLYGDYVAFIVCRHCGQMQGDWPESSSSPGANRFKSGKAWS